APEKFFMFGSGKSRTHLIGKLAFDPLLQRFDYSRHRHQHGYSLALDGGNHFARVQAVLKDHCSPDQRRNEHGHELSEDVAQRKQIEETDGMENAFVFEVLGNLALDWIQTGQQVAMREHYTARFSRGPGGKNNLGSVVAAERNRFIWSSGKRGELFAESIKLQKRPGPDMLGQSTRANNQFRLNVIGHALHEVWRGNPIHRDRHGPTQHAANKSRYPLRRILSPEHHPVALCNVSPC